MGDSAATSNQGRPAAEPIREEPQAGSEEPQAEGDELEAQAADDFYHDRPVADSAHVANGGQA